MRKVVKIIAWIAGLVFLAVLVAAIAIPLFFDPNDYKQQITAFVEDKTGRDLTIRGDIEMSVFPWLGVRLEKLRLSNAEGFGPEPFAEIETAQVRVKLLPLLGRELEMDTVVLEEMTLHLSRGESGNTNWDDLIGEDEQEEPGLQLAALTIGGVAVSDSRVIWEDQATGSRYTLSELNLNSGALAPNKDFDIDLEFDLESSQPILTGHLTANSTGNLNPDEERYLFQDTVVTGQLNGETLPGGEAEVELSTDISADLEQQTLTLADLKVTSQDLSLATDVNANLDQQTLSLADLRLQGLGLTISGAIQGSRILDAPTFAGSIRIAVFNPRTVMERLGIEPPQSADPAALTEAALTAELNASPQRLELNQLAFKVDETMLTGDLAIQDFAGQAISFALSIDQVDLDRYLPPPEENAAQPESPAASTKNDNLADAEPPAPSTGGEQVAAAQQAGAGAGAIGLSLEALREINMQGTLRIGKMKAVGVHSSDILITVNASDGQIRLQPLNAKLYEGIYQGNVGLDVRGNVPRLSMDESLTGVQAGPLLKDLNGEAMITGKATVSTKLTAEGATTKQIVRTLNGQNAFSFTNGAVKGFNIAGLIREATARLRGQTAAASQGPVQTDFSEISGTSTIRNGLLHNEDLSAKTPLVRITGAGDINLLNETMDYLLNATVVGTLEGQGGQELEELKGVTIPVRIRGPFSDLSYRPDVETMVSETAKAKVEERIEEQKQELEQGLQEKLGEELGEELQDTLKGLLQ